MKLHPARWGIVVAILCHVLLGAAAQEDARLSYRQLYQIQKMQAALGQAHSNLLVAVSMQSTIATVKPGDLKVYVDAKSGKIPVVVDQAGTFAIPMRADLLAENPWIVVNQPRGTMKLAWQVGIILGRLTNSVRYARLLQPVRECADVQEQMRLVLPSPNRLTMVGLKLIFNKPQTKASVILHTRGSDRKLETQTNGDLIIPLSPDLLEENPMMSLSPIPDKVEIATAKDGG